MDEVSKQHKTIAWNQPLLELLESTRLLYTMTRFIQYSVQKVIIGKSKERKSSVGESASGIEYCPFEKVEVMTWKHDSTSTLFSIETKMNQYSIEEK